jgi:hypothetical protein|tara:strand:+ start:437 stop:655 length:219 start_codon:yes stop_codon:yes gene_type:complete
MAMAKINLTYNGEEKTLQTDDFNEKEKEIYAEAAMTERELNRYKYLVSVFTDRRNFLLETLVKSVEDDKEET